MEAMVEAQYDEGGINQTSLPPGKIKFHRMKDMKEDQVPRDVKEDQAPHERSDLWA